MIATSESIRRPAGTLVLSTEDEEHVRNFEILLDRVRDRTRGVAERYQNGCYLVGRAGASKTFTVKEQLAALDVPSAYRNSRMSPYGLYLFLETHPESVCVIDDISTLFKQPQALQIIMAALGGEIGQSHPYTSLLGTRTRGSRFSSMAESSRSLMFRCNVIRSLTLWRAVFPCLNTNPRTR